MSGIVIATAGLAAAGSIALLAFSRSASTSSQSVKLTRGGLLQISLGGVYTSYQGFWTQNKTATIGDVYECNMISSVGSWNGTPSDSWRQLNADREYICFGTPTTSTGTLQIRRVGTTGILASAVVSFTNT